MCGVRSLRQILPCGMKTYGSVGSSFLTFLLFFPGRKHMLVLGVESSCDECSVAVVEDGERILSNEIATQIDFHRPFNGVVPEIASRMHTEGITKVARAAITTAGIGLDKI